MNAPLLQTQPEIEYPEDNGEPMSENMLQFEWITTIKGGLEAMLRDDPNVLVAGDLLWYPVENEPTIRTAPDAMVAFGRPKGNRGSYMQWREGNIPPQIVFEITSPGNRRGEMERKLEFYDRYGVEEYYIYDPDRVTLKGYLRQGETLTVLKEMDGWQSPRLGIRFDLSGEEMVVWRPDGKRFATYSELDSSLDAERQRSAKMEAKLRELGISPDEI